MIHGMRILSGGKEPEEPERVEDGMEIVSELEARARQLMAEGFPARIALELAAGGASPSECRELLKKGCSPELVLRILL